MKVKMKFIRNAVFLLISITAWMLVPATPSVADIAGMTWGAAVTSSYYSGTQSANGGGLVGQGQWATGTSLTWNIQAPAAGSSWWTYQYQFTVPQKDLSHFILETTQDATASSFLTAIGGGSIGYLNTYSSTSQGRSNPGMPNAYYGLKIEKSITTENPLNTYTLSFVSDHSPVWGNFYAKSGKTDHGTVDVIAYNTGAAGGYYVARPDGAPVPIPAAVWLLGSGLVGLVGIRRRIKK